MWPWLLAPCLILSSGSFPIASGLAAEKTAKPRAEAPIQASSTGPVSRHEADIVWKEGREAFEKGNFESAAFHLQRLVDRYPGENGYLEAHLLLGKSRIELKEAAKAIAPLKYYVAASGETRQGVAGRLELGRAYLELKKSHEALLTAMEAEKLTEKPELSDRKPEALLLKSQALMGLDQDLRASESLDAAKKLVSDPRLEPRIRASAVLTEEELKLKACARYPGKGRVEEDQLRSQLNARGDCLAEALLPFRKALEVGYEPIASSAASEMSDALIYYLKACQNPVTPPGKRSAEQLRQYRSELRTLLVRECRSKLSSASQLMAGWELSEAMKPHASYVAKTIERLK